MSKKYCFLVWISVLILLLSACNEVRKTTHSPNSSKTSDASRSTVMPSSATLHAVIVADTNDRGIGSDVDLRNITEQLEIIKENTGLRLSQQEFTGNDFKYKKVTGTLKNLSVTPKDMVIFYYSGHGANLEKQGRRTRWPAMKLSDRFLDLTWVTSTLKEKNPRFFIAMSDSCNNFFPAEPPAEKTTRNIGENPKNYQELFLHYKGHIIAAAAKHGQVAGGSPQRGGLFTNAFLTSLEKELSSSNPTWQALAKRAKAPLQFTDQRGTRQQQNPQFEINVTKEDLVENEPVENEPVENEPIENEPIEGGSFDETALSLQLLPRDRFEVGEAMQIKVTNQGANNGYLFVWDINSEGKLAQILPNEVAQKHRLSAGQTLKIPEHSRAGFSLTMTEPRGNGFIVALLVDSNDKQKVLSENLESSISATQAQSALQALQERLSQILNQSKVSFTNIDYEIF